MYLCGVYVFSQEDQTKGDGPSGSHKVSAAYVAIYDWTKQEDNQLSFRKGDKVRENQARGEGEWRDWVVGLVWVHVIFMLLYSTG